MKKISKLSILTFLALFAATLTQQGAVRAEDTKPENWGQVPTVTSEWTHITAGSTTGFELKDANYYVTEDLTFTNTISGPGQGSGMYVQEGKTVTLYIPAGVTLTAIGADAQGTTGAGAGILLPSGTTLNIIGAGTLVATGGNAANGGNGGNGTAASVEGTQYLAGLGGAGGNGGGGAGAGIGTAGGNGGNGAAQLAEENASRPKANTEEWNGELSGLIGTNGTDGATAAAVGTVNIASSIDKTQIAGGTKGVGGAAGLHGGYICYGDGDVYSFSDDGDSQIDLPALDTSTLKAVAGGGGGGGGAGGGSAQAIGTGGAGGGGGASGACGSGRAEESWVNDYWESVGAGGGAGGAGTEGNDGAKGYTCYFQNDDAEFDEEDNHKPGGVGGAAGAASVAQSAGAATAPSYKVNYYTIATSPSKTEEDYSFGSNTTITLPSLSGGDHEYKWILSIYGHAAGNTTSHCAAPNGNVYNPGTTVDLSNIYGAIEFCAVYVGCEIDCTSKENTNTAWASYEADKYAVVSLKNRKFYRDGYWNTLTLPFSLDASKLANTCLAGADIRTFKNAAWDGTNQRLTINFSDSNEGEIVAGVPCIVRWGTPTDNPGDVIEDPLFTNVKVDITDQSAFDDEDDYNKYETESGGLRFQAQIAPVQVTANSNTLLLGGENKLYKPDKSMWVYATRAYFTYTGSIAMARKFVMDFGEGEQTTTYIDNITVEDNRESLVEGIFNLNGQRLDAPQKGINIINGRKVVIK